MTLAITVHFHQHFEDDGPVLEISGSTGTHPTRLWLSTECDAALTRDTPADHPVMQRFAPTPEHQAVWFAAIGVILVSGEPCAQPDLGAQLDNGSTSSGCFLFGNGWIVDPEDWSLIAMGRRLPLGMNARRGGCLKTRRTSVCLLGSRLSLGRS